MKLNYSVRQANSPFDDSAIFIRNVYMKGALLLDCGRLGTIENSSLLDITDVFVTHTHMDHFSGFDRLLRNFINSKKTIRFFGPYGFIKNINGKLSSYTWNLIRDYDLTIEAIEITANGNKSAVFSAKNEFVAQYFDNYPKEIDLEDGFKLKYEFFDHGIVSLGYRIIEPKMVFIDKDKLSAMGFRGGEWIKRLKKAILEEKDSSQTINALTSDGEKTFIIKELEEKLIEHKKPQDITYITDIAPTDENKEKAVAFAKNSSLLIIEAVFMDADKDHAEEKKHLTLTLAKSIFKQSHSDFVKFLHFAPRYDRMRSEFMAELYEGVSKNIFRGE